MIRVFLSTLSTVYLEINASPCVFHIFHFFVKMGIVIQSRGLLCRERVEIFFPKTLHNLYHLSSKDCFSP